MHNSHFTINGEELPAVDVAETASGHPHTKGVEYTDDEVLVGGDDPDEIGRFGEDPDIETHLDEGPHDL